jgi:hypothetical protein
VRDQRQPEGCLPQQPQAGHASDLVLLILHHRPQLYQELAADSRPLLFAARASRLESAAVVVTRRGRTHPLAPSPCGGARFADARGKATPTLGP